MPVFKVIHRVDPYFAQRGLSKYHDSEALDAVISYCTRINKACLVGGIGIYVPNAAYEMERLAQAYGKNDGLRLRHWILSFSKEEVRSIPRKDLPVILHRYAYYAAKYYGHQYQIIFAVHLNTDEPHIHFVMNTVNYLTGRKYPGDKADYYAYQQYLQEFFREQGMTLIPVADQ